MKFTIIFITLCIASTFAVQKTNFLQLDTNPYFNSVLSNLKETKLGSTVATLIEIKMKLGMTENEDFDPLFQAFDELQKFLEDARYWNNYDWLDQQAFNTQHTGTYTGLITTETQLISYIRTNQMIPATGQKTSYQSSLTAQTARNTANTNLLSALNTQYGQQQTAYNTARPKVLLAYNGCISALEQLATLQSQETTLIQMSESNDKLLTHLKDTQQILSNLPKFRKESTLIKGLLSLTQEFTDQESLNKVMQILTSLKQQLWARLQLLDANMNTNTATYGTNSALYNGIITQSGASMVTLGEQVAAQQLIIDNSQNQIDVCQGKIDEYNGFLTVQSTAFTAQGTTFNDNLTQINFELGVLTTAKLILSQAGIFDTRH